MKTTFKDLFEDMSLGTTANVKVGSLAGPSETALSAMGEMSENQARGEDPADESGTQQQVAEPEETEEPEEPEDEAVQGVSRATLLKRHKDELSATLASKVADIDARLATQREQAEALLSFLREAHQLAKTQDREEEDDLKRQGVLVGAHVPAPPTTLDLPAERLKRIGGDFSDHLVDAQRLVGANLYEMKRRAGNVPWAGEEGLNKETLLHPTVPGYLKPTPAHLNRETLQLELSTAVRGEKRRPVPQPAGENTKDGPGPETLDWDFGLNGDYDLEKEPAAFAQQTAGQPTQTSKGGKLQKQKKKPTGMKLAQEAEEQRIMIEMDEKLSFLKNPRYDYDADNNKRMLTSVSAAPTVFIEASPSRVVFDDYAVDETYNKVFTLRNSSSISRTLRILPPSSQHFHIGNVQYPGKDVSMLAPGMSMKVTVRFTPDSLGQYEDRITVLSENGECYVHLFARRDPPTLDLVDPVDIQACLLGSFRVQEVIVKNTGGHGRFRILDEQDYPQPRHAQWLQKKLRVGPFQIWPTQLNLQAQEQAVLFVRYTPQELGEHNAHFVLVSEGCDVRRYMLRSRAQEVCLSFQQIGQAVAKPKHSLPKSLLFPPLSVGELATDTVKVVNTSSLDFEVRWNLLDVEEKSLTPFCPGKLCTNTTSCTKGFSISPVGTIIPAGESVEFCMQFTPLTISSVKARAILVVNKVPVISVPTPDQGVLKQILRGISGNSGWLRFYSLFEVIDIDGNGVLDIKEINSILQRVGIVPNKADYRKIMDPFVGQGQNLKDLTIPFVEFIKKFPPDVFQKIEQTLEEEEKLEEARNSVGTVGTIDTKVSFTSKQLEMVSRSVEVLGLDLYGAGEPPLLECDPPVLLPPGVLVADQKWETTLQIHNKAAADASFRFSPSLLHDSDVGSHKDEDLMPKGLGKVTYEPQKGCVEAKSSITIKVTVTFLQVGNFAAWTPIAIRQGKTFTQTPTRRKAGPGTRDTIFVRFEATVVGPRLRIAQKEVDFGLMAVGFEEEKEVVLCNESVVSLSYDFSQVMQGMIQPLYSSAPTTGRGQLSSRSRNASFSSNGSRGSIASNATRDSFMITNAFARLQFKPPTGNIEPSGTTTIKVTCTAGKMPQSLRGQMECKVKCLHGHLFESQHISYRGEIQAPKVYIDTTDIDLGVQYVDQPANRIIVMTNLSNLATKFKLERPAGKPTSFVVDFEPASGELSSKEVLEIKMIFTGKSPGIVDDLYACKIYGMKYPVGFTLKSTVKGVIVSYDLLDGVTSVPPPVPWDPSQVPSNPPVLNFDVVELFQRRTLRFAIRNFSAIPTTFNLQPKKYSVFKPVPNKWKQTAIAIGTAGSIQKTASVASASAKRLDGGPSQTSLTGTVVSFQPGTAASSVAEGKMEADALLHHKGEKNEVFRSVLGKAHVEVKAQALEDQTVLAGGKGAAFGIYPMEGVLPPWGMLEISVTAYNDMPGTYMDELLCDIRGTPRINLGLKLKVTGCPLSIPKDSVGMRFSSDDPIPTLTFGEVLTQALPPSRVVRVKNSGPIDANLTWRVRDPKEFQATTTSGGHPNLVDVVIVFNNFPQNYDDNDLVKTTVRWHDPPQYTPPFKVQPPIKLVPARSEATFEITMVEIPEYTGELVAMLVADAAWKHAEQKKPKTADRDALRTGLNRKKKEEDEVSGLEAESLSAVTCRVESRSIDPELDAGGKTGIKFKVWSTHAATLGKFVGGKKAPHPSMAKQIVMTNRLSVPLTFCLCVASGPFRLLSTKCLAPPHPLQQQLFTTSLHGRPAEGEIFTLPPGDNVIIDMGFLANTASQTLTGTAALSKNQAVTLKEELKGSLRVQFSTGHVQELVLTGIILRPMLVCSPSKYYFGVALVGNGVKIYLSVSNPTEVEAQWSLGHIPSHTFKKSRLDDGGIGSMMSNVDDPDVFEFSEIQGCLAGPTMPLESSGVCLARDVNRIENPVFKPTLTTVAWKEPNVKKELEKAPYSLNVTFRPKNNVNYCSRFRISVANGEGFDFLLSGKGTFEENSQQLSGQPRF